MAKPEWGTKRTCHACGARFYDLRRDPMVCPACGAVHDPERTPKPKRPSSALKDETAHGRIGAGAGVAVAEDDRADIDVADVETDDLDVAEDETAEDELADESGELMEDTSDLGADDDDIGEVMEHVDDEMEDKA
ncbi:MAG: TIGR02300 family protein [Rhodospirillales bacterium]|nr:TIGR02300 family protein [Rhodospirillales bacterium]